MDADHLFVASLAWTGNRGVGTAGYREYGRDHVVRVVGKPDILGSAARVFHGDLDRWNPEELLIAALAQCHLLSYLYVAVANDIVVESYDDTAEGMLVTTPDGGGRFREVVLRPVVTISAGDPDVARRIHADANRLCFIASSVNFPVRHEPTVLERPGATG
ncbi:MAG: OsmC family protein [Pseudolysinimonas sp.]|jgi:organic hydroperoxide reductase OsmC/OhrA|uniref:OsmC family protein n=1 Tax=Pseudolysinimonas sp. TaxID=2680009 RepID=UPI003C75F018